MNTNTEHVDSDQRYDAANPCPICGGHEGLKRGTGERCTGYLAGSGKFAFCSRVESAKTTESATGTLYVHALAGECSCGHQHGHAASNEHHANGNGKAGKASANGKPKTVHKTLDAAIGAAAWSLDERGNGKWKETARYHYRDAEGKTYLIRVRFEDGQGNKEIRPIGKVGTGWVVGNPPKTQLLPYRFEVLTKADPNDLVVFVEGEKAADAGAAIELLTTTTGASGSAGSCALSVFSGRDIVILPDRDEAGQTYAVKLTTELLALPKPPRRVRVLPLPGLGDGDDLVEWLEALPDSWEPERVRAELFRLADQVEPESVDDEPTPPSVEDLHKKMRTEFGLAERMRMLWGTDVRYCHPWSKFLVFDGRRWKTDTTGAVAGLAKRTVRATYAEAALIADDEARKAFVTWVSTCETAKRRAAVLSLLQSEEGIPIEPADLSSDPWLLNVQNGTIDLRTGTRRPHRRRDLIGHLAPVEHDPAARCPLWTATLAKFFAGNPDLIRYVMKLMGYCLTGTTGEQILPVFWGTGSNGKSTILGAMMDLIGGDLAYKATPELLLAARGEHHPTERASLFGKRLVTVIETEEGGRLNEPLIKELTGGDVVTARRMREDPWSFSPTHKLILATNHKPVVRGTDYAIWRRLHLIPFTVAVPTKEARKDMPERLRGELPGILNWALEGCRLWQLEGLEPPAEVADATSEYRAEQDVIGAFIAEECVVDSDLRNLTNPKDSQLKAKASAIYARYKTWTEGSGEFTANQRRFGSALSERGFGRYTNNGIWYGGLGLRAKDSGEDYPR